MKALSLIAVLWLLVPIGTAYAQTADGSAAAAVGASYTVRSGDVLRITVWPDTMLGGKYPVENTGLVYLPVVGEIPVAGRTLDAVRRDLRRRYGRALKAPVVTVTPLFNVSVLGAVRRPSLYQVDPTATLFEVITMAGGFREDAEQDEVRLIRRNGNVVEINAEDLLEGGGQRLRLDLRSGDRIIVPRDNFQFGIGDVFTFLRSIAVAFSVYTAVTANNSGS